MKVRELMIREVGTCRPDDDLNAACKIMWEGDCGTVPVVDDEERVLGMITDRDACMAAYTTGLTLGSIPVRSAMAKEIVSCSPEDTLEAALSIMRKSRVRRLPVVGRDGNLAGILSINDLARETWREIEAGELRAITTDFAAALNAICERAAPPIAAAGVQGRDSRPRSTLARSRP